MIRKSASSIREMVEYVIMLPKKCIERKKICCKCATFFPEPNSSEWEAKQEKLSINNQLKKKKNIGVDNCEHLSYHWLFGQFMSESARIGT